MVRRLLRHSLGGEWFRFDRAVQLHDGLILYWTTEVFVEFSKTAETIEFPDNSGRRRVMFRPRGLSTDGFIADVTITMESFEDDRKSEVALTALQLSRNALIDLDRMLAVWQAERTSFEIDLGVARWARFELTVGPDSDYITSADKPAVRIDVDWCGITAIAVLVVDQSCMRIFHEGVANWLQLGRASRT